MEGVRRQDVVGSSPIDPKYYLRVVLRRKWLILTVFVLVVGSVAAWTMRQPKVYETQDKVITSRAVSQRVVEKLGLQNDAAFLGLDKIPDEKRRAELMKNADPTG